MFDPTEVFVHAQTNAQFISAQINTQNVTAFGTQSGLASPPVVVSRSVVAIRPEVAVVAAGAQGPAGSSDGFEDAAATTVTVGGIPVGSTFPILQTVQQMFDALLYPYQHPGFTGFSIAGVSSPLEVGSTFGPSVTFDWSTSQSGNVATNSITLSDTTLAVVVASGLANSGSYAATLGGAVTLTSTGTHSFTVGGTDTHSTTFQAALTITWQWRLYYGVNTNPTLTAAQILALASSTLATGYAGSFSTAAGGYKFLCLADAVGSQLNTVKDAATFLAVPMNAGSHTDGGGFGYELVNVTNGHGVATNVRVYRTLNSLGGALQMVVT